MFILFIIASFLIGFCLLKKLTGIKSPIMMLSGSFLIGCLFSGTFLYWLDILFVKTLNDYYISNIVYLIISAAFIAYVCWTQRETPKEFINIIKNFFCDKAAVICFITFLFFSTWLNYSTFSLSNGNILMSGGAWSDITLHNGFVRSISIGHNIPVEHVYYDNTPIKYHFLFDYFVGKISQTGLHSVHALNLMCLLSLSFLLLMIFQFGRTVFKSDATGILGALFLLFHSSISGLKWIYDNWGWDILKKAYEKTEWLALTLFEGWGLFNLNVFVNQRHFAFSLALLVFVVNYVISLFEKEYEENSEVDLNITENSEPTKAKSSIMTKLRDHSWILSSCFIGLTVGITPYWNSVVNTALLSFLGLYTIINITKKDIFLPMLVTSGIAGIVSLPQLLLLKSGDSSLNEYPKLHIGYEIGRFDVLDLTDYYFKILGLKLIIVIIALFIIPNRKKILFLILSVPFILANLLQLGVILYDNSKLMIASLIFINCLAAHFIVKLFQERTVVFKFFSVVLSACLMVAGVLDLMSVKNLPKVTIADKSDFTQWIIENTEPGSTFLTLPTIQYYDNVVSNIFMAGGKMYVHNAADSAYKLDERFNNLNIILRGEESFEKIKSIIEQEGIDYIVVSPELRQSGDFPVNENFLIENFVTKYNYNGIAVYSIN